MNDRVGVTVVGSRVDGRIVQLSEDRLLIASGGTQLTFQCSQVERIEKRGDPVWNGAVIGAAIVALPAWNGCQDKGRDLSCVTIGIGTFAALGALVDRAHVRARTVYVASPGSCAPAALRRGFFACSGSSLACQPKPLMIQASEGWR